MHVGQIGLKQGKVCGNICSLSREISLDRNLMNTLWDASRDPSLEQGESIPLPAWLSHGTLSHTAEHGII